MNPHTPSPKNISDLIVELENEPHCKHPDFESPSSIRKSMAKLNALLNSPSPPPNALRIATSHAAKRAKHYHQGATIMQQPHSVNTHVFPFLALPPELRLNIYFELLVSDDRLTLTWRGPKKADTKQKKMYTAILQTCKLCSDEALGVLYGENLFDLEEICRRPKLPTDFLSRIGPHNAARIRLMVAEYSAASEELSSIQPGLSHGHQLTRARISRFLSPLHVRLSQLRLLAISIIPYGCEDATWEILRIRAPGLMDHMPLRLMWLARANREECLAEVVEGICARDGAFKKMDFWYDVHGKLGFMWNPPSTHRMWIGLNRAKLGEEQN